MSVLVRKLLLALGDVAVIAGSILAAYSIRLGDAPETRGGLLGILRDRTGASTLLILSNLIALYVFDAYNERREWRRPRSHLPILGAVLASSLVLSGLSYLTDVWKFGRGIFALEQGLCWLGFTAIRFVAGLSFRHLAPHRRIVLVGTGPTAEPILKECVAPARLDCVLAAIISARPGAPGASPAGVPCLPRPSSFSEAARDYPGHLFVVALEPEEMRDAELVRDLLQSKVAGVPMAEMTDFYKQVTGKIPIYNVSDRWFLQGPGFHGAGSPFLRNLSRLFDLLAAATGWIVTLPLWPLLALLIKATSRGPVLYRQVRLGLGKKPFTLIKFRTMVEGAEEGGAAWAQGKEDTRVTLVGRFLRGSRLDEIPQFWNILKGEMSLIGPRPERPEFVERLEREIPFYDLRFSVRPGLTGWAQVNFRYGASVSDAATKLQYELY
jgi:exopolysaccharide biosynthesis polyprenyl glycosylphosphotransferase